MGACTYGLDQILAANSALFITLLYATTRRNPTNHLSVQGWFPTQLSSSSLTHTGHGAPDAYRVAGGTDGTSKVQKRIIPIGTRAGATGTSVEFQPSLPFAQISIAHEATGNSCGIRVQQHNVLPVGEAHHG